MTPSGCERRHGQTEEERNLGDPGNPDVQSKHECEKRLSIRKRKGRKLAWESDETIVLWMSC